MAHKVDALVIGAGVVGLACARRLAMAGFETLVVERESSFGMGISSRNSEVIHAGLYYRAGSLKARLCRDGREALYAYCKARGVAHQQLGKWIVAVTSDQVAKLENIRTQAHLNGCEEVDWVGGQVLQHQEPSLKAVTALSSPRTGIVDVRQFMLALLGDLDSEGGSVVYRAPVNRVVAKNAKYETYFLDGEMVQSRFLINATGLDAPAMAACIEGLDRVFVPHARFAKGNYFSYGGPTPFKRLIYPIPEVGGLGVHLTLDLAGQARFGPDVEWIDEPDYRVSMERRDVFCEAIQRYWPACDATKLMPAYSGVRPKIVTKNVLSDDFIIQTASEHGLYGLVNLMGIESPGLTSCLPLADYVFDALTKQEH